MITASYDDSDGLVRTTTYGVHSRVDIENYLYVLDAMYNRARAEWGRVLHIVDATLLEHESDENLRSLAGASIEIQRDGDKTAVIAVAAPVIEQAEQMPSQLGNRIFGDIKSAKAWLYDETNTAASIAA